MDNEGPQLPAPLIEHECDNCGHVYLDDCQRLEFEEDDIQRPALPPAPVDYAQAVVISAAGIGASYALVMIVDKSFSLLEHGVLLPFDFNIVVGCVCSAFGAIAGYAWAKKKKGDADDNDR